MKKLFLLLTLSVMLFTCSCVDNKSMRQPQTESQIKDEDVHNAIIEQNAGMYLDGEALCEGNTVLSTESGNDGKITLYALVMYGEYGFENGNFVKVSGSGVIPTKLTFKTTDDKKVLESYEVPEDGSRNIESTKKLFPKELHSRVLTIHEEDERNLKEQEVNQANEYLKSIGRTAQVGDYGDFEHILLTDLGVSVEASNKICTNKDLGEYPNFVGTKEKILDGIRYLYKVEYKKEKNSVVFSKIKVESQESKYEEYIEVDAVTGEIKN